jgi:stage II sporulation protein D
MKKVIIKALIVCVLVLLFPFLLTLLLSSTSNQSFSMEAMDFQIYYEKDGSRQLLDFDQYLIGVVAANMPVGYHVEALKAQAVITRTYALYNIALLRKDNPSQKEFTSSELGLSFISLDEMKLYWGSEDYLTYFTKLENSVFATKDEVLLYNKELILPAFFHTGSGYTRNASEAWGVDIPYLVSVQSRQDVTSINYLKIKELPLSELIDTLLLKYPDLKLTEETFFQEVRIRERDSTGYVTKIDLGNQTIYGEEFAKVLGLNSNNFYIEDYNGNARIICTGIGHGVGLSQYGANAMADEGYTYSEILSHYYKGVKLVNLKD